MSADDKATVVLFFLTVGVFGTLGLSFLLKAVFDFIIDLISLGVI